MESGALSFCCSKRDLYGGRSIHREWQWSTSRGDGAGLLPSCLLRTLSFPAAVPGQFLPPLLHQPLQGPWELPLGPSTDPHLIAAALPLLLPPQLKLPALILLLLQFLPRPSLLAGRAAEERALGRGSGPPWCPPKKRARGAGPASRAGDAFWWSLCLKCVDTLPSRGAAPDRDHGFVGRRNIFPARRASPGTALPSVWQPGPAPASYHNVFSVSGEHVWVRK